MKRRLPIAPLALLVAATAAFLRAEMPAPGHGPTHPGGVFTAADQPTVVCQGGAPWALHDWRGREVRAGIAPDDGLVALDGLPCGYYIFAGDSGGDIHSVIVVPDPATRRPDPDGTICADTAFTWLAAPSHYSLPKSIGNSFDHVADLMRLAGLTRVRERMSWGTVQPSGDKPPDWGLFGDNARRLKERGISVCDVFHSTPGWARPIAKLPGDFAALYRFCCNAARDLDATEAWEFWNEQVEGFAPEPAWDYAAAMKAAALGFRAGRPDVKILNGSLCKFFNDYDRVVYASGIGKYTDIFNVHSYSSLKDYPAALGGCRAYAEELGEGGKAIWVTEIGTLAFGPGLLPGRNRAERTFSPEQEILNAEFFPKSQALAAMEGMDRNYYFVFAAFSEDGGKKEFSIIRRDGTPMPAFAAISTMTDKLAGFALVGEMDAPEGIRAFLYETAEGIQTVLFWSVSDLDTATREQPVWRLDGLYKRDFALPAEDGKYTVTDLCGTPSRVAASGGVLRLKSVRYPQYAEGLRELRAARPARTRGRPMRYTPAPDEDLSVVIRAEVSKDDFEIGGLKSVAQLLAPKGHISFEVWNLSDKEKRGALRCLSGGTLAMPDGEVVLPPMGMVRVEAIYTPALGKFAPGGRFVETPLPDKDPGRDAPTARPLLRVEGCFDGKRSTPLVIPVEPMGDFLAICEAVDVGADDPANWTRNDSADEYSCERDGDAVKFRVKWNAKADQWFYPKLALRPEGGMDGAEFLVFEARSEQPGRGNGYSTQNYWLDAGGGVSAHHDLPPTRTEWTRYRIPLRQPPDADTGRPVLEPRDIAAIRVGGNPVGPELLFWFRNVRILKKPEGR